MEAKLLEQEAAEKRCHPKFEQLGDEISPIGRHNNDNDNRRDVIPDELSFLHDSIAQIEEKERKEKEEQEAKDFMVSFWNVKRGGFLVVRLGCARLPVMVYKRCVN